MLKTYGWPSDTGACRFYRTLLPADALNAAGHDAAVCSDGGRLDNWVRRETDRLIILQRSSNLSARFVLSNMRATGRPFVFDLDDWLWGLDRGNPAYAAHADPTARTTLDWMAQNAAVITCSTEPLAANIRDRFGRNPHVIPNALPLTRIEPNLVEREPTVLWRGSPTHRADIEIVGPALQSLEQSGVRVVLAGADYRKPLGLAHAELLDELVLDSHAWVNRMAPNTAVVALDAEGQTIPAANLGHGGGMNREQRRLQQKTNRAAGLPTNKGVTVKPAGHRRAVWMSPEDYFEAVNDLVQPTIVIAPLQDTTFNASKSHIAALEAHASGAYVIASDVPAYSDYLTVGGTLVPRDPDAWHKALHEALEMGYNEWRTAVEAGADLARQTSIETCVDRYVAAYTEANESIPA